MSVVYVREQGAIIRKRGGRILVEKDRVHLLEIPLRQTNSVAVFGNVQVTTQALSELLERSIPLALYTRHGRLKGHLTPAISRNVALRLQQYQITSCQESALPFAAQLIRAKLMNCASMVAGYQSNYSSSELTAARSTLEEMGSRALQCTGRGELLGVEGAGAAAYFKAFTVMNRSGFPFSGRDHHPAPDPINALLGLGYTILTAEIRSMVETVGLDPYIGFLHQPHHGQPALALDLLEPFRPAVVDRLTLRVLNERVLTEEHFAKRISGDFAGSVILSPLALPKYLEAYERIINEVRQPAEHGMRRAVEAQVMSLAQALRGGPSFEPYLEQS